MEKLTVEERNRKIKEEMRKRRLKLKEIKESMWKLRKVKGEEKENETSKRLENSDCLEEDITKILSAMKDDDLKDIERDNRDIENLEKRKESEIIKDILS